MDSIATDIGSTLSGQRGNVPDITDLSRSRQVSPSTGTLVMQNTGQLSLNSSQSLTMFINGLNQTTLSITNSSLQSTNSSLQAFDSRSIRREPLQLLLATDNLNTKLLIFNSGIKAHQCKNTFISQMNGLLITISGLTNFTQRTISIDLIDRNNIILINTNNLTDIRSTTQSTAIRAITLGVILSIDQRSKHARAIQRESTSTLETHCPVKLAGIINITSHSLFPPFLSH